MRDQAQEILDTEVTMAQYEKAQALLESCPFTTTALRAMEIAITSLGSERQGETIRAFLSVLAEVEAKEV